MKNIDITKQIPTVANYKLKTIADDYFNGKIYSNLEYENYMSVFLNLILIIPKIPTKPSFNISIRDTVGNRDNIIDYIVNEDVLLEQYEYELREYYIQNEGFISEFLKSLGFVYEYLNKAVILPDNFNGRSVPIFFK